MIVGLDSSIARPTAAQADQARAAGVGIWSGYLATVPPEGVNLAASWTLADFEAARRCGSPPLAFCSGWDDPAALRRLAAAWRVRLCLDCEDRIRGDGAWVDPFLQASGAGLYGLLAVHYHPAPFHVAALYPVAGCPGASWPTADRPPTPCSWQCQGTHDEFGVSVDRGVYDDWFATPIASSGGGGDGSMVQVTGADGTLHRLEVVDEGQHDPSGNRGGPVTWVAIRGGTGGLDAWQGGDGELPGGGGWVAAGTLAASPWLWTSAPLSGGGTGPRELLIIEGRWLDGRLVRKAVFTDDFSVQSEWAVIAGPSPAIPGTAAASMPYIPHRHQATTSGTTDGGAPV